jgi:hypothetical protein
VAKYAVLSEADFERLNKPAVVSVSVWARFAQPSRLVWSADEQAADKAASAIAEAAPTLLAAAAPLMPGRVDPLDLWRKGFELTYSAELRSERQGSVRLRWWTSTPTGTAASRGLLLRPPVWAKSGRTEGSACGP